VGALVTGGELVDGAGDELVARLDVVFVDPVHGRVLERVESHPSESPTRDLNAGQGARVEDEALAT